MTLSNNPVAPKNQCKQKYLLQGRRKMRYFCKKKKNGVTSD